MSEKTRHRHSPEDKARILLMHLLECQQISDLCEVGGIQPTMFFQWQKTFFEKGSAAFEAKRSPSRSLGSPEHKISLLESKLRRKDEVIAGIMEDLVRTKKDLGDG